MARVLITGASGFIGSHLVRACLARGDEVTAVVRPASQLQRLQQAPDCLPRIRLLRLAPEQPAGLARGLARARPEVIFHAGSGTRYPAADSLEDLSRSVQENLLGLTRLLAAAASCPEPPRVLLRTGTIAEYGSCGPSGSSGGSPWLPWREDMREAPQNAYGAAALACTHYMAMAQPRLPFAAVTARLALAYGPGQSRGFLIPQLISNLLAGRETVLQRPQDRRELVHVDDVVRGLLMIADRPAAAGPVLNLGSGEAPRMEELAARVARLACPDTDAGPAAGTGDGTGNGTEQGGARIRALAQPDPPTVLACDSSALRSRLGWQPRMALSDGLERTIEWERRNLPTQLQTPPPGSPQALAR